MNRVAFLFLIFRVHHFVLAQGPEEFVKLADLDDSFAYEMRYASTNNFLKQVLYDCDQCVLRKEVADALIQANDYFKSEGYRILLFDCYRPVDVQWKMWKVFPNPSYVANPEKGSVHNRGGAVDLTLVDIQTGEKLDMGTDFDHFGREAHHDNTDLSKLVLFNRSILKNGLERFGFQAIRTEWWHYSLGASLKYDVSNFKVTCNE